MSPTIIEVASVSIALAKCSEHLPRRTLLKVTEVTRGSMVDSPDETTWRLQQGGQTPIHSFDPNPTIVAHPAFSSRRVHESGDQRKVDRVERWCKQGMALTREFEGARTTRTSFSDEQTAKGHRRVKSAPISMTALRDIKASQRLSRCITRCAPRYSLSQVRLRRPESIGR